MTEPSNALGLKFDGDLEAAANYARRTAIEKMRAFMLVTSLKDRIPCEEAVYYFDIEREIRAVMSKPRKPKGMG